MIDRLDFKKMVFLGVMGIVTGAILFQSMSMDVSMMGILTVICALVLPFLLIWPILAKDVLVAILTFSLPFNVDQTFDLHQGHIGGAKGYMVSVSGIAIVLLYLLLFIEMYRDRDKRMQWFPVSLFPLLGILLMSILSLANAPHRWLGFYEILEFFKMAGIFLFIANYVQDNNRFQFVVILLIAGLFSESMIAILQRLTGTTLNLKIFGSAGSAAMQQIGFDSVFRVGGTLGGPNALAWYLDFLLPVGFALLFFRMRSLLRIMLISVLVAGSASLIITLSRGGWMGFLISLILIGMFQIRRLHLIKRVYLVLLLLLFMISSSIVLLKTENPIQTRFKDDDQESVYVRLPLMKVAAYMIKAHPFIGSGINNYTLVHHQYDHTPEQVTVHFPYPVHNVFLQLAAEIGLPGLLLFLWFIFYVYYRLLVTIPRAERLDQNIFIGIIGALTAGLMQGMVENSTIGRYHLLPFWFLCGMAIGRTTLYKHASRFNRPANQLSGDSEIK